MKEPRCCLRNRETKKFLSVKKGWKAWKGGLSDSDTGENESFKLQWCKRTDKGKVTCTLIRTDTHPQSLLDVSNLHFEGGALNPRKCEDRKRWWDVIHIIEGQDKTFKYSIALKSVATGKYLVDDGKKLTLSHLNDSSSDFPDMFKWELYQNGRSAASPAQVQTMVSAPAIVISHAVGGGAAGAAVGGVAGAAVGAVPGAVGGAIVGAVAATFEVFERVQQEPASEKMFVDW
ncbi:MAG: hypothetical protein SGBAC_002937 [Bacillariaceae sp.]